MKLTTKPRIPQPPPRIAWHYDNYFLEQLAKTKPKTDINQCKTAIV